MGVIKTMVNWYRYHRLTIDISTGWWCNNHLEK